MKPNPNKLAPIDAATRFAGVVMLALVGYLHLLDVSHKVDEGVYYMAFLFSVLIVGAIVLAIGLVRSSPGTVRLFWAGAALLAAGALFGYFVSRAIPLPQLADHRGDWVSLLAAVAAIVEVGLIATAAYAMRELTLRGVKHAPPPAFRLPVPATLTSALLIVTLLPQQAFGDAGHGEEDAGVAAAGSGGGSLAKGGADPATGAAAGGGAHGDPFLGTAELGLALLATAGFVWWAARSLADRVHAAPVEG